ncbi:MAG TPA: fluoride efflux transporter CrcB [Bacillales bacterium]
MLNSVLVLIGGFFGAVSRFGVSQWMNPRFSSAFPVATLAVNLSGAFLLGLLVGSGIGEMWLRLLGTGFMGAFTTFSTFKLENIELLAEKKWKLLIGYLAASYIGGVFLAFIGMTIGLL